MAEEEKKEEAKPAPAKSKKKLFIIIGAVLGSLVLIGVPVGFFVLTKKGDDTALLGKDAAQTAEEVTPEGSLDQDELGEGEEPIGAIFPLETFVVNLSGGGFIRVQMQLEFQKRDVPQRFYPRIVPVRDGIINLLSARTRETMLSANGREALKADVKNFVNETLKKEDLRNVYFTQFVVQ